MTSNPMSMTVIPDSTIDTDPPKRHWIPYGAYRKGRPTTVRGDIYVYPDFFSPQLDNRRDILVYLPRSYFRGRLRYPVVYMHDGQNLFDDHTSFVGEWHIDESMELLSRESLEAIIVGIPNMGADRLKEYGPFPDPRAEDVRGRAYVAFIADTLKPLIDRDFRTHAQRNRTIVMGSSMGGLISLYAFFARPDVFGAAGVMSPSLWFGQEAIFDYVRTAPFNPGRIYIDMGKGECLDPEARRRFWKRWRVHGPCVDARRLFRLLITKGYKRDTQVRYVEAPGDQHNEAAWARRFPRALRFLL